MGPAIGGIRVHVMPDTPRYQLPSDLPLPPAFRAEFNDWAARFLGSAPHLLGVGQVVHTKDKFFMNPRTYKMMREKLHDMGAVVTHGGRP